MTSLLQDFLKRLEKESMEQSDLLPFFKCIFTYYYVFPISEVPNVTDRSNFLQSLSNDKNLPKIRFILKSFNNKQIDHVIKLLETTNWWWKAIYEVIREGIDIYKLSHIFESLTQTRKKKTTGLYFTPPDQVQFICYYSLYQYLILKIDSVANHSIIHQILFRHNFSNSNEDVLNFLIDKLSSMSVIDPSCGTGLFLHEIINSFTHIISQVQNRISINEYKMIFENFCQNIYGYDIDSDHIILTKLVFLHHWITNIVPNESTSISDMEKFLASLSNIKETNFLLEDDVANIKYDLCVGNPPYIRHHDIDKRKIIEKLLASPEYQSVFLENNHQIDSKADLYFYFWMKLMLKLTSNGVLGLVLSRSWYSSRFLAPINFLLFDKYFNIDLILELPSEPWETAEIITNIIIGHKIEKFDDEQYTNLLVWKGELSNLLENIDPLSEYLKPAEMQCSTLIPNVTIKSAESDVYRISQISNPHMFFSQELINEFPILRIDYFNMAPFLLHKILLANKDKFCLLNQLGNLRLGSTTGANRFFYLTEEKIRHYDISQNYLVPMTKSPKDNISLSTASPKNPLSLLYIPSGPILELDQNLQHYLSTYEDELLSRPYFRNKSKKTWYQITKIQPVLIIPNMTYLRSFVAYNKQKFHIDKQWIGFWPDNPDWNDFLVGFMNSSLGILLREIQGTRTLGLGSLKLSLRECRNLLTLDPRLVPKNILRRLRKLLDQLIELPIPRFGEKTKYSLIQRKMDQLICIEYLGLAPHILDQIKESIKFEVEWRLGKPIS